MNKTDRKPSSRRSPYKKFSDTLFSKTGLPLPRLLMIIFGLLLLGASILYATRDDDTSSQLKSRESEANDFIAATSIPQNFSRFSFPVQIEKLDQMIERCSHLLSKKKDYSVGGQEKLLAPFSLKAMAMSKNGLDPAPALELLQKNIDQISNSSVQKDAHQYLLVGTYMGVLAEAPESDCYTQAMAAISTIQETTPAQRHRAMFSFNSAMKYHRDSKDKDKSGKLVRFLGNRLRMARDQEISEYGFSLIDFTNYFQCYEDSIRQSNFFSKLESETTQLMKQIKKTPPESARTYNVLMNVPEQHLQAGNKTVALKILDQLTATASSSPPRIRDRVLEKLAVQRTRINLLKRPFPLSGFDAAGSAISPPEKEQILILFFNPDGMKTESALQRVANSPLRKGWSTETYLASASELSTDELRRIKETYPTFIVVDRPTSEQWLEKSGIDQMPYLVRLDKESVVQRLSFP